MANLSRVKKQSSAPAKQQAPDYIKAIIDSAKNQRDTVDAAVNDLVRICGAGDPYLTQKILDALCNVSSFVMPSKRTASTKRNQSATTLALRWRTGITAFWGSMKTRKTVKLMKLSDTTISSYWRTKLLQIGRKSSAPNMCRHARSKTRPRPATALAAWQQSQGANDATTGFQILAGPRGGSACRLHLVSTQPIP